MPYAIKGTTQKMLDFNVTQSPNLYIPLRFHKFCSEVESPPLSAQLMISKRKCGLAIGVRESYIKIASRFASKGMILIITNSVKFLKKM